MKINKALRMVIPIEQDDGQTFYVHASSISREIFEQYFLVISKAFSAIYNEGLGITAGPRIAALMVRRVAEESGSREDVERGLLNEIKRLANVVISTPDRGWETISLHEAVTRSLISGDEVSEVENALTFFSLASAMHKRAEREGILKGAVSIWGGQITSSDLTEFSRSLPTSTATASSGEMSPALSVPS